MCWGWTACPGQGREAGLAPHDMAQAPEGVGVQGKHSSYLASERGWRQQLQTAPLEGPKGGQAVMALRPDWMHHVLSYTTVGRVEKGKIRTGQHSGASPGGKVLSRRSWVGPWSRGGGEAGLCPS